VITFALEKMADIVDEIRPLHLEQWQETEGYRGDIPFNPDYKRYIDFSNIDYYLIYAARQDGKLVGHLSLYVTQSMHTQTLLAQEDTLFLTHSVRGGRTAYRLFQFVEADLKRRGVKELYCSVKAGAKSKALLEFMGCQHVADMLHKLL